MADKFYHTKDTVQEYIKLADGYDGRELIEKLKQFLPGKSTVLEIGAGPGKDLEILNEYYITTGSDFSTEFLDLLREKNPNLDLLHLNAITLETKRTFDGIFSNKVLHHLTDIELKASIKNQYHRLNENGVICHSFWKGDDTEEMHGLLFNYHTTAEIEEFFVNKFETMLLETYEEIDKNDSILIIARKNRI